MSQEIGIQGGIVFKGGERRMIFTARPPGYKVDVYMLEKNVWAFTVWYGDAHMLTRKDRSWKFDDAKKYALDAVFNHGVLGVIP